MAESKPGGRGAIARLPTCLRRAILRRVPLLLRRLLRVAPAAVVVLLPAVTLLAVDVAVAPGVDIAASGLPGERSARAGVLRLTAAPPPLPSVTRVVVARGAVGDARRRAPSRRRAARRSAPAAVDAGALPCRAKSRARVVGFCRAAAP